MAKILEYFEFIPEELVKIVLFNLDGKSLLKLYVGFNQFKRIYDSRYFISELLYYKFPYLIQKLFQDTIIFNKSINYKLSSIDNIQLVYDIVTKIFNKYVREINGNLFTNNDTITVFNLIMSGSPYDIGHRKDFSEENIEILFPKSKVLSIYREEKPINFSFLYPKTFIQFMIDTKNQLGVIISIKTYNPENIIDSGNHCRLVDNYNQKNIFHSNRQ